MGHVPISFFLKGNRTYPLFFSSEKITILYRHPNELLTKSNFEKLICWQKSIKLANEIYKITRKGELRKDFGLRDQLRRSAISVPSNIAEGKERESLPEYIRFLFIAKGSLGELKTQIIIAFNNEYITKNDFQNLMSEANEISVMLGALIKSLKRSKS